MLDEKVNRRRDLGGTSRPISSGMQLHDQRASCGTLTAGTGGSVGAGTLVHRGHSGDGARPESTPDTAGRPGS